MYINSVYGGDGICGKITYYDLITHPDYIPGGSFKIPLMVLVCSVPMRIAVGKSSAMVAAARVTGSNKL